MATEDEDRDMGEIVSWIIVGLVAGGLASALMPGRTPGGLLGMVGGASSALCSVDGRGRSCSARVPRASWGRSCSASWAPWSSSRCCAGRVSRSIGHEGRW